MAIGDRETGDDHSQGAEEIKDSSDEKLTTEQNPFVVMKEDREKPDEEKAWEEKKGIEWCYLKNDDLANKQKQFVVINENLDGERACEKKSNSMTMNDWLIDLVISAMRRSKTRSIVVIKKTDKN